MPQIVTVTLKQSAEVPGSGIEIERAKTLNGEPAICGIRIVHVDPLLLSQDSSDTAAPRVGDEIITINGLDAKNTPYLANKLISEAIDRDGDITLKVLRDTSATYRKLLLSNEFGEDFSIDFESARRAILKPKDNPSVLVATLSSPLQRKTTRYKYAVTFNDATAAMSLDDVYEETGEFNRSEDATPEQQQRIKDRYKEFMERLMKVEEKMESDRQDARQLVVTEGRAKTMI